MEQRRLNGHIAVIADTYPPLRTSGAVQLRDLTQEFKRQGFPVTVLLPDPDLTTTWGLEDIGGVEVLRLKSPRFKDVGYIRRAVAESVMSLAMSRAFRVSPLARRKWGAVVWYSPTIFLGHFAKTLISRSRCRSYLILRDIFPQWAADMGLMSRGLSFSYFDSIANYQYRVADTIGVQSVSNIAFFANHPGVECNKVQVLQNWLGPSMSSGCSINVMKTPLAGRRIFVYAGNMGVAQGAGIFVRVAKALRHRRDVGFIFVGRGSEADQLAAATRSDGLDNVLFHDEISPDEIPGLFEQCHVGLLALDPRHRTHNVPGKFLTYMRAGLPVLACVNPGNDLETLISTEKVGRVAARRDEAELSQMAADVLSELDTDDQITRRCRALFHREFSVASAANQIIARLHD